MENNSMTLGISTGAPSVVSVSVTPQTINPGETATGTVIFSGPSVTPFSIEIRTSRSDLTPQLANYTVGAGVTTFNFTITSKKIWAFVQAKVGVSTAGCQVAR